MTGIDGIALHPLLICGEGQCWNYSARSSVTVNLCLLFSPAAALLQVLSRSGFPAGVIATISDATSTSSGLSLKPKRSPTVSRIASRICADSSLRAARLVSKGQRNSCSINSSRSPLLAPVTGRLFFEVTL